MLVILPMHHRSPNVAGTVPTSSGGALAELAEPALLGAVIAHPTGGHDAQLHVHGAPDAVLKVTASTAPAAAVGRVRCVALVHGSRRCVRTADSRRGRWRHRRGSGRRRSCSSAYTALPHEILEYPVVLGGVQSPSHSAAYCLSALSDPDGATRCPRGPQRSASFGPFSRCARRRTDDRGVPCDYCTEHRPSAQPLGNTKF